MPASIAPSINASLCPPPIRWNSTRGLRAPSHSAATGSNPQILASRGSAQTIIATPINSNDPLQENARNEIVAGDPHHRLGDQQVDRAVRARGVLPSDVDLVGIGVGVAEDVVRAGVVRVEAVSHHRADGEVGVHVPGEQWRGDHQGDRPHRHRVAELAAGEPTTAAGGGEPADQHPAQHDQPDTGVRAGERGGPDPGQQPDHPQTIHGVRDGGRCCRRRSRYRASAAGRRPCPSGGAGSAGGARWRRADPPAAAGFRRAVARERRRRAPTLLSRPARTGLGPVAQSLSERNLSKQC